MKSAHLRLRRSAVRTARIGVGVLSLFGLIEPGDRPWAQEPTEAHEEIELRVSDSRPGGIVVIDRGSADGLAVGDLAFFHPRDGGTKGGNVLRLEARRGFVELHDKGLTLEPGTRGKVLVPVSRFPEEARDAPPEGAPQGDGAGGGEPAAQAGADRTRAQARPDTAPTTGYALDSPLLARMRPVRPEDRAKQVSGRVYVSGDGTFTTQDDRSDSFLRGGTDLLFENPFGRGGGLHFDGEANFRTTDVPDEPNESFSKLRIDRASYYDGGTRFEPWRWEAGRFLQVGLPELGVLDGVQWSWRRKTGDTYGVSLGYLPVPDADFSTGEDFQLAGFYEWVIDHRDHFTLTGGFQKTFHDGDADRDLLIGKLQYAPRDAWQLYATTWVDLYGSSDTKDAIELTQAVVFATRRWNTGNGVTATFTHQSFPEIDREEFRLVEDEQLEEDRDDRLSLSGWRWTEGGTRLHGEVGAWVDEDHAGGDVEAGIDLEDLFTDRSRTDVTGFASFGEFSRALGGQASFGRALEDGRWDLFYEFSYHTIEDFNEDVNDLVQHRLRASRDVLGFHGWDLSLYTEGRLFDDEGSISLGVYMYRSL